MKNALLLLLASPVVALAHLPSDFDDDIVEISRQMDSIHGIHEAVVGSLRARGRSDDEILYALEYVMDHPAEFRPRSDGQAAGCLRLLNSTNAFFKAESLLDSDAGSVRWQATLSYCEMAFSKHYHGFDPVERFKTGINRTLKYGAEVRHWVYLGFDNELRRGEPKPERQRLILRFLLDQAASDSQDGSFLDAILCREVPKWRASPQRAENAAKMVREHPDDARLVAFFETVRTNALQSAGVAFAGGSGAPAGASRGSEAGPNAASDPWAGLLDDLPAKTPWVPTADGNPLARDAAEDAPPSSPPTSSPAPKPIQAMRVFSSDSEAEDEPASPTP